MIKDRFSLVSFWTLASLFLAEGIVLALSLPQDGWGYFVYYTNLSNLLAFIFCPFGMYAAYKGGEHPHIRRFELLVASALLLTLIVVFAVLGPLEGYEKMLLKHAHILDHIVAPILMVFLFCFVDIHPPLDRRSCLLAILPTMAYGLIIYILNLAGIVDGPYPFLRIMSIPFFVSFVSAILIVFIMVLISFLLLHVRTSMLVRTKK